MERDRSANAETVVDEALDLLLDQKKLEHLRAIIAEADAEIARGEVYELTPQLWEEINAQAEEMVRKGIEPDPDVCP